VAERAATLLLLLWPGALSVTSTPTCNDSSNRRQQAQQDQQSTYQCFCSD
jgi:hypothetical protein